MRPMKKVISEVSSKTPRNNPPKAAVRRTEGVAMCGVSHSAVAWVKVNATQKARIHPSTPSTSRVKPRMRPIRIDTANTARIT